MDLGVCREMVMFRINVQVTRAGNRMEGIGAAQFQRFQQTLKTISKLHVYIMRDECESPCSSC